MVCYGPEVAEAPDTLDRGSAVYRVRNVYIGAMDGEAARLMLLPLTRLRRPLPEVLREVALLARGLPRQQREETLGTMIGLAFNYLGPEMSKQLLEVLTMANALENLIAETLVRGREEGKAEGRTAGMRDLVRDVIEQRFGALPEALERRIADADERALRTLLGRLPSATRLEDLLGA